MQAHVAAVQTMITTLRPVAQPIVAGAKPDPGELDNAANVYETALRTAAQGIISQTGDKSKADFISAAKDSGWIFAGTQASS